MAQKYDLTNKQVGKLTVLSLVPKDERPTQTHGNYWLCKCSCGEYCKVPTSYLTGNGNYTQTSCGCDRKKRAFQVTTELGLSNDYLETFNKVNFERYSLIHKALVRTTSKDVGYFKEHLDEYKSIIDYFYWHDKQFDLIYKFWQNHKQENNTFYDWAKPSLDHIIPTSKGGSDDLSNLQFLTTFENLAKRDMTMEEWNEFKKRTHTSSDYFIEFINKG